MVLNAHDVLQATATISVVCTLMVMNVRDVLHATLMISVVCAVMAPSASAGQQSAFAEEYVVVGRAMGGTRRQEEDEQVVEILVVAQPWGRHRASARSEPSNQAPMTPAPPAVAVAVAVAVVAAAAPAWPAAPGGSPD